MDTLLPSFRNIAKRVKGIVITDVIIRSVRIEVGSNLKE
jgi:hypothetical protein